MCQSSHWSCVLSSWPAEILGRSCSLDKHGVQEWQGTRGVGCEVTEELEGWGGGAEMVAGGEEKEHR